MLNPKVVTAAGTSFKSSMSSHESAGGFHPRSVIVCNHLRLRPGKGKGCFSFSTVSGSNFNLERLKLVEERRLICILKGVNNRKNEKNPNPFLFQSCPIQVRLPNCLDPRRTEFF